MASQDGYNTRRSAFWRITQRVARGLVAIPPEASQQWSSVVIWSNLYKVAPAAGSNPPTTLMRAQEAACIAVLGAEVQHWNPRRILLLTGSSWADPFTRPLGWQLTRVEGSLVEQVGVTDRGASVVVAPHPQGKRESALTAAIVAAFHPV